MSAGTVNVSCCPFASVTIPIYVVVTSPAEGGDPGVAATLIARLSALLLAGVVVATTLKEGAVFCAARLLAFARILGARGYLHFSWKGVRRTVGEKG